MNLLLDTNILIHLAKSTNFHSKSTLINPDNLRAYALVVTIGELKSIAVQNNWGARKLQSLDDVLEDIVVIEINENWHRFMRKLMLFRRGKIRHFITTPLQRQEILEKTICG